MESAARLFTPPRGSFFLFGPRGTGKSTFVRERFAQALTLDLLDTERVRSLSARVSRELYYWRTRSDVEVDFVVYGPDGLWALEVKNSGKVAPEDLRGLRAFQEEYPFSHTLRLYRGKDRLMKDKILCLPCESFLRRLHPDHALDEAAES